MIATPRIDMLNDMQLDSLTMQQRVDDSVNAVNVCMIVSRYVLNDFQLYPRSSCTADKDF